MATIKVVEFKRVYNESVYPDLKTLVGWLTEDPGGIFFMTCDRQQIKDFTWKEENGFIVLGDGGVKVTTRDDATPIVFRKDIYSDPKNLGWITGAGGNMVFPQ